MLTCKHAHDCYLSSSSFILTNMHLLDCGTNAKFGSGEDDRARKILKSKSTSPVLQACQLVDALCGTAKARWANTGRRAAAGATSAADTASGAAATSWRAATTAPHTAAEATSSADTAWGAAARATSAADTAWGTAVTSRRAATTARRAAAGATSARTRQGARRPLQGSGC